MCSTPPNLPVALTDREVGEYKDKPDAAVSQAVNDGSFIVRNACQWDLADKGAECVQSLGHSMNAVRLPKGRSLTYTVDCEREGDALLHIALIPTQPNDTGDLRFCVSIDGAEPQVFNLKEPFRSERWKQNVLRAQTLRNMPVTLKRGRHSITIKALDNHVVLDQWMLDFDSSRKFYLFPVGPSY